jgi:hypothetical protein
MLKMSLKNMIKKIITAFMACWLLAGSCILPLGDFSLIRDIPEMYRNYTKITSLDELGILDFIGDYLLHGKELLGHNVKDKAESSSNTVQFMHQANPISFLVAGLSVSLLLYPELAQTKHPANALFLTSDYRDQLLRPPLS